MTTASPRLPSPTRALLLATTLLAAGCPIGNDRLPKPDDLSPAWRIDKLRVLGMRGDPAEVTPGGSTRLSVLAVGADGLPVTLDDYVTFWLTCSFDSAEDTAFGCLGTSDAQTSFLAPTYTAPADMLDGRDEGDRVAYGLGQVFVIPSDRVADLLGSTDTDAGGPAGGDLGDLDPELFNDVESAFKRIVVSDRTVPNLNPEISGFTVDGVAVPDGAVVRLDPGQTYAIGAVLAEGADELYDYTNRDGTVEERHEEPWVRWYSTGGTVREEITLFGYLESDFTAPATDAEVTSGLIWAVARDRRGGMGWRRLAWALADAP